MYNIHVRAIDFNIKKWVWGCFKRKSKNQAHMIFSTAFWATNKSNFIKRC